MSLYLGIDIGTTSTKTILIDCKGGVLSSVSSDYDLITPKPNWAEQIPEDWWKAVKITINKILSDSQIKAEEIKGIGLSGQMHGSVFLDKKYNVIRPAILWCDQRTKNECIEITDIFGKEEIINVTKNPVLAGFTLPKIIWLRNNEPENYEKINKILLPKDYIRFKLTGEFATEVSDASGTSMLDVGKRKWSKEIVEKLGLDYEWLPECYESVEITGRISDKASQETGLKAGTPVVGGAGDNAASGIGTGIVKNGIILATIGTSGVIFAYSDSPVLDKYNRLHTFCHAVKGKWHMSGVILTAGGALRWFRDNLAQEIVEKARKLNNDPYDIIMEKCEKILPGAEGLFFLPYLTGIRTPYPDPDAKGVFLGLSLVHTKAHLIRSVVEGITFGMKDSLELVKENGLSVEQIRITGGGSKNKIWKQIQADIYGYPVSIINADEGAAFGVALLAATGAGEFSHIEEACRETIKDTEQNEPNIENLNKYKSMFEFYKSLYPAVAPKFRELSNLI